ncbi:response regulator [bacterium]|nr:response regulator [bacterium]
MGADNKKNSPDSPRSSTPDPAALPLSGAGFGSELYSRLVEQGRLKATSVLAAGFSHDINNLMSIILGNVGMLQRDEDAGTDLSDRLWTIEQSAKRVAKIADELIAFARMDKYNPRPLQMNSLLEETLVMYQRSTEQDTPLNQVLRAAPDIVIADGTQIQQLVIHLVENAVEATAETDGDVFISTSNEVRQQPSTNGSNGIHHQAYVTVTVRDDGHGMAAETLDQMYEPFFSTRGPGRGMGLSAVYGIVQQYDGIIEVESEPDQGTIFRVLLPAEHVEQEPIPEEELDTRDASGTILVVDDEAGVRELLTSLFERVGYTALGAENGKVALEMIAERDGTVDLVLLDLLMPVMDGATTFAHLHRYYPDLPVLLISGYDHDERVASLLNDGALAFIQKPFELELVLREVRRALELSRQESPSL